MADQTLILVLIIVAGFALVTGILAAIIGRHFKRLREERSDQQALGILNQNIQGMQTAINQRLDNAARVIGSLNKELGAMQQIGSQLQHFQDFLKSPKLRGSLGERGLKDMLAQVLPAELYSFQHRFRDGETVDAAIKIQAGIIPVDAKFPLENFNQYLKAADESAKTAFANAFRRDFRNRVNEIARKYIKTDEGTVEFAFMYLPSESVWYEVINNDRFRDLFDYATNQHIVITSPSTFFYYLRTIMLGLEGQRINELSRQILSTLKIIRTESRKMGDNLGVLGRHITNAKSSMDTVSGDYTRLSSKIETVGMIESAQEKELLDKTSGDQSS